ncbi:MAG: EamA family transporter [Desulfovibrionaceae bacterium]|nr:EamA family transporter [Desulfovibrionaceae bacterium]
MAIILTALLWSFIGLLSKFCLQSGMQPLQSAYYRSFFGLIAFLLHSLFLGQLRIPFKDALKLMSFGAWGIGVYYSFAQITIELAGAAMDIILQYTAPFWVVIFARIFFNEVLTKLKFLALSIAFIGTLSVCLSGGSLPTEAPILGIITGLVTGLCYASHFPFTRFWQQKYPSGVVFTYMLAGGSLALALVNHFNQSLSWPPNLSSFGALVTLGLACTYFAFLTYGYSLRHIGLVQAVIISELEPVLSMFWVWLFFGESFSALGWGGSFLIILAVLLLVVWKEERRVGG